MSSDTNKLLKPLVTVIAVCLNHERFVEETLESIRNQTYKNLQLLIYDNGSSDKSHEIIAQWVNSHATLDIKYYRLQEKLNLCSLLNTALELSRGEYIQLISCDDFLELDKLERHVNLFASLSNQAGVIFSDAYLIDETGFVFYSRYINSSKRLYRKIPEGKIFTYLLENGNFIPGNTCLIRADTIKRVGGYDPNLTYEDYDMWLRIAKLYEFHFDPKISAYYRIHGQNFHTKLNFRVENFWIFYKHIDLDRELVKLKLLECLFAMYRVRFQDTLLCYGMYKQKFDSIPFYRLCYWLKVPSTFFELLTKFLRRFERNFL